MTIICNSQNLTYRNVDYKHLKSVVKQTHLCHILTCEKYVYFIVPFLKDIFIYYSHRSNAIILEETLEIIQSNPFTLTFWTEKTDFWKKVRKLIQNRARNHMQMLKNDYPLLCWVKSCIDFLDVHDWFSVWQLCPNLQQHCQHQVVTDFT